MQHMPTAIADLIFLNESKRLFANCLAKKTE